jgi:hypothetical protein
VATSSSVALIFRIRYCYDPAGDFGYSAARLPTGKDEIGIFHRPPRRSISGPRDDFNTVFFSRVFIWKEIQANSAHGESRPSIGR